MGIVAANRRSGPFGRLFLEGVVIVASILLALALCNALHKRIARAIELTVETVQVAIANGDSTIVVPDTALMLAFITPTFDPRLRTLDGLLSAGCPGLLQDPVLRTTLAGWPGLLSEGTEEEVKGVDQVANHLVPVLRSRIDTSHPLALIELFPDSLTDVQNARVTILPVDNEVPGVLAHRHAIESHGIDDLGDVRKEIDRILKLIEAHRPG
jgi:hypothetical protein